MKVKEVIRKVGDEYVLYSKDGSRVLGRFPSKAAAQARERQINYFKSRKEGMNMPEEEIAELLEQLAALPDDTTLIPVSEMLVLEAKGKGTTGEGREFEVTIIGPDGEEGLATIDGLAYVRSRNGRFYNTRALEESVPLWDGIKVYDNHLTDEEFKAKQGMRSVVNEWVGVIVKPWFDKATSSIKGTLKVVDETLQRKLKSAWEANVLDKIGLSIDAMGTGKQSAMGQLVEKITKTMSVDVVADPAAGGRLGRMLAAEAQSIDKEEILMSKEELLKLLEKLMGEKFAEMKESLEKLTIEKLQEKHDELKVEADAKAAKGAEEAEAAKKAEEEAAAKKAAEEKAAEEKAAAEKKEAETILEEAKRILAETQAERRLMECGAMLHKKLEASGLPLEMRSLIVNRFEKKEFEEAELDAEIKLYQGSVDAMTKTGTMRIPESQRLGVSPALSGDHMMELAFMRMVMGRNEFEEVVGDEKRESVALKEYRRIEDKGLPEYVHLSRWYSDMCGGWDNAFDGRVAGRMREANITTSNLTSIIKNTVNIALAHDYSQREQWWAPIVKEHDVDNLDDFTLVRIFGVDNLPVVSEGATYTEEDSEDQEETASYIKKGYFMGITLETMLQDKLNVIRTIPKRMSNAWYNTISALVASVFTVNSATGPVFASPDSGALFNATALSTTGGHKNLLTTALGYDSFIAARLEMRKQTDKILGAGRRLTGNEPDYLLISPDLENTALELLNSQLVPHISGGATGASDSQTINTLKGKFKIIFPPDFTDTNNWALVNSRAKCIHLIWVRGRRTPELISALGEKDAAYFTNDTLRYKIRQFSYQFSSSYTCAPVSDFRGLHKSNVSGA